VKTDKRILVSFRRKDWEALLSFLGPNNSSGLARVAMLDIITTASLRKILSNLIMLKSLRKSKIRSLEIIEKVRQHQWTTLNFIRATH